MANFDNTYEWCASKVSPQKNILRNIPPETMGTWIPTFQKGESIIIRNVNEIVSYDPTVYETLIPQNLRALLSALFAVTGK